MLKNVWNILSISVSLSFFQAVKKETNKYRKISSMWKHYATAMPGKIFGPVKKTVVFQEETVVTRLCPSLNFDIFEYFQILLVPKCQIHIVRVWKSWNNLRIIVCFLLLCLCTVLLVLKDCKVSVLLMEN